MPAPGENLRINPDRLWDSIHEMAEIGPGVAGGNNRYLHVLSVDGAVSSAVTTGTSSQPGVTVNLAGGGTATVLFNRDTAGGTITINGVTTTLAATVDSLTEGHL